MNIKTSAKQSRRSSKEPRPSKRTQDKLSGYQEEAKEIAAAKQAMLRLHRGIEFEPERLHYVISLHTL